MSSNEFPYRDYRIVLRTAEEIGVMVSGKPEADHCKVNGIQLPYAWVVLDEFDDSPMPLPHMWFEAPLTARAAVDIHLYKEGFQTTFWPNYHDAYIAMRHSPSILRALQDVHRAAVNECEENFEISEGSFPFKIRERLARLFILMEFRPVGGRT